MSYFSRRAEERIREAMERGEFDDLPGAGQPLCPDPSRLVPEELRLAYKLLRDAGCVPPEVELRKEALTLRELLSAATDEDERIQLAHRLNALVLRLNLLAKPSLDREDRQVYVAKLRSKIAARREAP